MKEHNEVLTEAQDDKMVAAIAAAESILGRKLSDWETLSLATTVLKVNGTNEQTTE